MRLGTIWTTPAMTTRERTRRTIREWAPMTLAAHLPKSIAYWSYVHQGVRNIRSDEVVPEVLYVDILTRTTK